VKRFREKSSDYGDVFKELGIAGQYSDMHRKMYKLKRAMWEGEELKGEPPEEILSDLFGNILISIYLYEEAKDKRRGKLGRGVQRELEGEEYRHDAELQGEADQRAASSEPGSGQDTDSQGASTNRQKGRARKQTANAVRKSASP